MATSLEDQHYTNIYFLPLMEIMEKINNNLALFLSGFFETGGFIKMEISHITRRAKSGGLIHLRTTTPIVGYSDSDKKKLDYLKSLFGGGIHKEINKNSYRWYLKSRKISPLVDVISEYTPSLQTFICEFNNWSEAKDVETKVEIAKRLKKMSKPQPRDSTTVKDYRELVLKPQFLAGVFEARGALYKILRPDNRLDVPSLVINSQNYNLLSALKERFGGSVTKSKKNNSMAYLLGKHQTQAFLEEIPIYLPN